MKNLTFLLASLLLTINIANAQKNTKNYSQVTSLDETETTVINRVKENPDDFKSNYYAAAHYYNLGIGMIDDMDFKASDKTNLKVQDDVFKLFKKALPYAKKASELEPNNNTTLHMLSGIYFGLNKIELSEEFEKLALKAEGIDTE